MNYILIIITIAFNFSYLNANNNHYSMPKNLSSKDYQIIADNISENNPIGQLFIRLTKAKNARTDNPNYYKVFFKDEDARSESILNMINDFNDALKKSNHELNNIDNNHNYEEEFNKAKNQDKSLIEGIKNRISLYEKAKAQETTNQSSLEETIKTDKLYLSKLEEEFKNFEYRFNNINEAKIKNLKNYIDDLNRIKEIITKNNDEAYPVITSRDFRIVVNVPNFNENHVNGAYYNDFYHEGDGHHVIIFDRFKQNYKVDFSHYDLEGNIYKDPKVRPLTCMNAPHPCQVMGILQKMIPNITFIPELHSLYPAENQNTVNNIITNNYPAKVINISANLNDKELLAKLTENHIVVMASPNMTEPNASGYDSDVLQALEQYEHVRDHLLVVINLMPDGSSLSPISSIPGDDELAQYATVASPGTWLKTTYPDLSERKLNFETVYAYAKNDNKPRYGSFMEVSGSSFATPIVTGLVLRLAASFPDLSLKDIVTIVKESCNKDGDLSNTKLFGNGKIDVSKAYEIAKKKTNKEPLR